MIRLVQTHKRNPDLEYMMRDHYSQPKGFVGRSLCYLVYWDRKLWGATVFGSATRHLPGREIVGSLNNGANNIFYHLWDRGRYPCRNFASKVVLAAEEIVSIDWVLSYGDRLNRWETLVELPRSGELYRRAGYVEVGQTIGYTCKREGGEGTDSWTGKRVWNTTDLRPKRVFVKPCR